MVAASGLQKVTLNLAPGFEHGLDPVQKSRLHLVLGVSPEFNEILDKLAVRYECDKADVINMAVGILKSFAEAADEGKRVGIASADQELETEITGL
jgi:hypothetical protein